MAKKKRYRPSALTIEARTYQIFGSREMWLREQKEIAKRIKNQQNKDWKKSWNSIVEKWEKDIENIKKNLTKTKKYIERQLEIKEFLHS